MSILVNKCGFSYDICRSWLYKSISYILNYFFKNELYFFKVKSLIPYSVNLGHTCKCIYLSWHFRLKWIFIIERKSIVYGCFFKGGLSLKTKNWHIDLYFITTKYLWNNALVEYLDNWIESNSLIIIYQNRQK